MKCQSIIGLAATLVGLVGCTYYDQPTAGHSVYSPGYVVTTLPSGYATVTIGGTRYYHHNDVYYRSHGSGYVVVERPSGYGGHRRHDIDRDGRPNWNDPHPTYPNRNVTVIRELPSGYRVIEHGGRRYYRAGDVYYESRAGGYIEVRSPF